MKRILFFFGIFIYSFQAFSQESETVFEYTGLKLTGVWGGTAFAYSQFDGSGEYMRGGFGALEFNKKITIGYFKYWVNDRFELSELPAQEIDFQYSGLNLGYSFLPQKRISPKVGLLVGGGQLDIKDQEDDRLFVIQPHTGVDIRILKWFHIDLHGGYRVVSGSDINNIDDELINGPFASVNLRFGFSWGW